MEYQGESSQYYCNYPKVQLANTSYDSSGYFVSSMNSHVDVASHNNTKYVASTATFDNAPHNTHHNYGCYGQEPMSIVNSSDFGTTSNIQHVNPCLSAISTRYVVSPQDMPMNERIGYDNANNFANCSQNSAPYANAPINNSALHFTLNSS